MVRATSVSWQSDLVERLDTRTGQPDDEDRFADMQYDTVRHSYAGLESFVAKRADQRSVKRYLMQLRRAETFAGRFEELSQELREQIAERLPVDVALRVRLQRLRERFERHTGGVLIEERHAVREQLKAMLEEETPDLHSTIASTRNGQRKYWSSRDVLSVGDE